MAKKKKDEVNDHLAGDIQTILKVKLFDNNARREAMQSDVADRQHNWVPLKKHPALLGLRKNK